MFLRDSDIHIFDFLQYGRKDIESTQNNKIKDSNGGECITEEVTKHNKTDIDLKYSTKQNGIKNGMVNGTNQVINRDDNLILVPEPIQRQSSLDEQLLYNENKVS